MEDNLIDIDLLDENGTFVEQQYYNLENGNPSDKNVIEFYTEDEFVTFTVDYYR